MGSINLLAVLLGALAFFAIGAVWYGPLFGRAWKDLTGFDGQRMPHPVSRNPVPLIMALAFAFELLIALMLGHTIARSNPAPHVVMMMAVGFAISIMIPALGINYLFQQRPGKLFAIDAGYLLVGMTAMGGVFLLFR